jgi:plasmid stabilization system protein ParE
VKLITLHPDAEAEITEAARYYELREPGLGSDLLGEVEGTLDQILKHPEAHRKSEGGFGGSPCGDSLTIWYMRFIRSGYEW